MINLIMILLPLMSCGMDVAIIKNEEAKDTASTTDISEDTVFNEDSKENKEEDTHKEKDTQAIIEPLQYVGIIEMWFRQATCPSCLGYESEITQGLHAYFNPEVSRGQLTWIPSVGSCGNNIYTEYDYTGMLDVGDYITVENELHTMVLYKESDLKYSTSYLNEQTYLRNTQHVVSIPFASGDVGTFKSVYGFTDIQPYEMLWVTQPDLFTGEISRSGQYFTWQQYGEQSHMLIQLDMYTWDGASYLGNAWCMSEDTGSLYMSGEYLNQFPVGSLIIPRLRRIDRTELEFENFGIVESYSWHELVATGILVP